MIAIVGTDYFFITRGSMMTRKELAAEYSRTDATTDGEVDAHRAREAERHIGEVFDHPMLQDEGRVRPRCPAEG